MIRVLHLMRSLNAGGIGTFIMNVYRKIDRSKIQFDFAITNSGMGQYGEEIEKLGGNIYFISQKGNRNIFDGIRQVTEFYRLCKGNEYAVVHCHYYFANTLFLMAARFAKVSVRVSHCHNAGEIREVSLPRRVFEAVAKKLIFSQGTVFLGCSEAAAEFLYGRRALETGKAKVLYNGIDYDKFNPDNYDTEKIRREMDVKEEAVCIFVGRYEEQKNPLFALSVFNEIYKKKRDTRLIMIGYGSLKEKINDYILENSLGEVVTLLPPDADVAKIQAISDVMIAPSVWEGLSIAYIEAQKMLTIVIASKQISTEVDMGYCEFLELGQEKIWADRIINLLDNPTNRNYDKTKYVKFDVNTTVDELLYYYGISRQ